MKTRKIRFTRGPAGAFKLAYFVGDVTDIEEKQAKELIRFGFAEPYESEVGDSSDLPPGIPGRKVLVDLNLSLEDLKSIDDLTELNGIGAPTAAKIKQFLEDSK